MNSLEKAKQWLKSPFDQETVEEVRSLIDTDPATLEDSFYTDLAFGTGGMRGVLGAGTNRINKYTLGRATQGLANFLKEKYSDIRVVIAYDCRHGSDTLSRIVAEILSANDIKVSLFSSLRTTPELSFAVRHLNAQAGIVLTASHNPPEYNGYKVYSSDGGQIVPPEDKQIIEAINAISFDQINFHANTELIELIDEEVDNAFFAESVKAGSFKAAGKENFKLVFTSIHGTSITAIPPVLELAGFKNVAIVKEQAEPNGDFPTVKSPNPEETEALAMAMDLAETKKADMVIGTDPDSDRLGIAVRNPSGALELLNGNQTMIVMTEYLLRLAKKKGFKGNEFIASTIVSTPMLKELAKWYDVDFKISLTGFKWIGKMIKDFPQQAFIGGGEESYGFMVGDFVRDKDAVTASLLASEIGSQLKSEGSSFYNLLIDCYLTYGFYKERLISITKKGQEGASEIRKMMSDFEARPPKTIVGETLKYIENYNTSIRTNLETGEKEIIDLPTSNVIIYETTEGTRVAARPSGTEPKIKFYISTKTQLDNAEVFEKTNRHIEAKIDEIISELQLN
ncbi:MAG: phospho-sugar mutase [Flavobacteriaceae bacterium]|nr:phospho-sugar mutase [Flavobacteriaceae bacterium]